MSDEPVVPEPEPPLDPDDLFHSRIVIKKNGEVVIENLSMDLMELALLLDPDTKVGCDVPEPDEG
jgi:hypothetical protein